MTRDQWTDRVSEYLDGDLGVAERAALEAHVASCPACEAILAELRRVVARAQAIHDLPPTTDLWPAIAQQIGVSSGAEPHGVVSLPARRARRRLSFTVPQLAAAAAVLLLLGSGGAYLTLQRGTSPVPPPPAPIPGARPGRGSMTTLVGWEKTRAKYDVAVAELEGALEQGRKSGRLDSATVRVLEQSLVTIDSAIVQARRALAADPGSVYLNQHLADTMRRKLQLLRRASALAPART